MFCLISTLYLEIFSVSIWAHAHVNEIYKFTIDSVFLVTESQHTAILHHHDARILLFSERG